MESQLLECIRTLAQESFLTQDRLNSCQEQIANFSRCPGYPTQLCHYLNQSSGLTPETKQLSAILLRQHIQRWWDPKEEEEAPLHIADEEKESLKQILPLLLPDQKPAVVTAISLAISGIAVSEWPHRWPNLLPQLLNMFHSGKAQEAALQCLSYVTERIGLEVFDGDVYQTVIGVLSNFTQTTSTLQIHALSIFQNYLEAAATAKDGNAPFDQTLLQHVDGVLQILAQLYEPPFSENTNWTLLVEGIKTLMPLVNLFRSVIVRNPLFHHVLQKITDSMLILIDVYESTFVYSIPPNVKDSDYTLEIFFLAALNLLDAMTGGETFDKVFTGALPKLTNLLVRCMQIPRLSILQWQESIDNYLRDESEDLVKATVRSVSRIVFMELFSLCLHHDDYDVMVQTKKPKQKKKAPIPTPFESDELRMNVSKNRRELETLNQINLLAGSVSDLNSFSDMVRMEACVTAAASIADIRFNEAEDEDDALLNYLMGMPMQRGGQKSSCPWDAQTFTSPFLQQLARPGIETDESELAPLCSSLLVLIGKASSQLPPETISTYLQRIIELLNQRPADQPQTSEIVRVSAHKTIQMISHSVDPSLIAPFFVPLMHAIYAYITAPSSETSGVFDGDEPMVLAETILGLIRAGQGQITGVAKTILDLVILLFDKSANNSFIIGILADIVQLLNDSKEPNLIFEVQAYLLPQLFTRINYVTSGQAQAEGVNIEPGVVEGLLNIVRLTFRESSQTQPFPPGGPNDGHYNTMYTMVDAILPKQDLATIDPARVDGGSLSEASEILCDLVRLAPHLICSPAGEIDQAKVNFIYQFSVFMFSPVVSETAALHVGVLLRTFLWTFWDHLSSDIKQSIASVVIHKFFVCRQANFAVTLLPVIVFFTRRIPDDFFALIANVQLPPDLPTQITNPPITWSPLSLFINNWCQLQTEVRGDFDIRASLHALQSIVQRIPDSRGMLVAGPIIPTAMPTTRSKSKTNPDQHSVITLLTRVTQLTIEVFSEEELNQAKIRKPVNLNEEDDDDDGEEDEDEDEDDIDSYIANLGGVGSNPIKTGVSQTDVDALIQSDPLAQMNTMVLCCQFMLEMRGVMEENSIQLRPEETKTVGRMVQFLAMTQSN